tara:strand:+ start:540 stop:1076 length:537 start_codon:yes stop_codon:yes gene_type:complete
MQEFSAKLLRSEVVHTGRVFNTVRDQITLPNGKQATLDIVRHPASVILLPMPDNAHLVLVRQYRYAIDQWIWELPAGNVEPGENLETAARRECHEEICRIPERVERIADLYPAPGYSDELMVFFRLVGLTMPSQVADLDEDEMLKPQTFALAEVRRLFNQGKIVDLKTALGIKLLFAA